MALLHRATLTPTKLQLLEAWGPEQPWFVGDAPLTLVANFRFDDPLGEVGVETLLVRAGDGPVMQVPVTYRDAPLAGAEAALIGTTHHSVLGPRWVYDGLGDPVYLQTLAATVLSGGTEVEMWIDEGEGLVLRPPTATVVGSGTPGAPVPDPSALRFDVIRVPGSHGERIAGETLLGSWPGVDSVLLAVVGRQRP
jgi:hypothetical protein